MLRLIWAELKKILLNIRLVTVVSIFMIATIVLTSVIIYFQNRYYEDFFGNPSYDYNYDRYTNTINKDYALSNLNDIEASKATITQKINTLKQLDGTRNKELLSERVQVIEDFVGCVQDITKDIEQTLIDGFNITENVRSNITLDLLDDLYLEGGILNSYMKTIADKENDLESTLEEIRVIEGFVYFPKRYYGIDGYLFVSRYAKNFLRQGSAYEETKKAYDGTNFTKHFEAYIYLAESVIHEYGFYNNYKYVDLAQYKAAIENALFQKIDAGDVAKLEKTFTDSNGAFSRLDRQKDEIIEYLAEIETFNLSAEQTKVYLKKYTQVDAYADMLSNYVNNYSYLKAVKSYTDKELAEYNTPFGQNKYDCKAFVTLAEYIIKNDLKVDYCNSTNIEVAGYAKPNAPMAVSSFFMGSMIMTNKSLYAFVTANFIVLSLILIVVSISIGGGSIAGEQTKGTIKMLIIRPYKRWKILTAKIIGNLIISLGLILLSLALVLIIGAAMGYTTAGMLPVLCVFNASKVIIMHPLAELMLNLFFMYFCIIIYTLISTLFSVIFKSRTLAVVVSLVLNFFGTILSMAFGRYAFFRYLIFNNTDLFAYFAGGSVLMDMNFWLSLIVCIVYAAVCSAAAYITFTKRDLI